jgi:UDP-N-acetyl-D-mannosaminuronic acid dehydrogenase
MRRMFEQVCILGMGYIGLPMASTLATHGVNVVGVDIKTQVLEGLKQKKLHIQEPGLQELVQSALESGNLHLNERPVASDAFIIAVPTPVAEDKTADLSHVVDAARSLAGVVQPGNLVVLESTSPPRTTVDLVAPILAESGHQPGEDFFLAYIPERVLPGNILIELIENARVIGGINDQSAARGKELYQIFVTGELLLTDATTAEMVKLMENTYRDVNIATANEFSRIAEDLHIDIWEAIRLANHHPRVQILRPGPGAGGHCVSVDPWFLAEVSPGNSALIRTARHINDTQPEHTTSIVETALGTLKGRKVAALGLAYKADVDDLRESPAVEVVERLLKKGAEVRTYDPYLPHYTPAGAQACTSLEQATEDAEALVLLVDHMEWRSLDPTMLSSIMPGRIAVDTRGIWLKTQWETAGFELHQLGVGQSDD